MKKFLRSLKTKKLVVLAIIVIIATVFEVKLIATSAIYTHYSIQIKLIEKDANSGIWTSNGYKYWTDDQIKAYNEALEKKSSFIKNSDFAMYLYHSAFSSTGKCFRIISIVAILTIIYFSVNFLVLIFKILTRRFKRYAKRLKHFHQKTTTSQKNQG